MKNWLGLGKLLILLCLLSVSSIAESQSFDQVSGFEVLATHTSENTACMRPGSTRVILRATEPNVEGFLNNVRLSEIMQSLQQSGISQPIEVEFTGPNITIDQINTNRQRWNDAMRGGCITLTGADGDEFTGASPSAGYVFFENIDAGSYTDDNAQAVNLIGPTTIGNSDAIALLNNVVTNSSTFYFLQNGFLFLNGNSFTVWTNTTQGLVAQPYTGLPYSGGISFWFTITYTNGSWWMCGYDPSTSSYVCVSEPTGLGTTLEANINTSIFLEVQDTASNWYSGYSGNFQAWGAQLYRNGFGQNWSDQHRHTGHACSTSYPVSGAMTGSLVGGGTGSFIPAGAPLWC